jgi:hypothetical protein
MKKFFWVFAVLVALVILGSPIYNYATVKKVEITVKSKERVISGKVEDAESKYLIYTTDEVFENTDNFLFLKFKSSDIYNNLDEGKTYNVKVNKLRIPFLSKYRNIIKIYE